MAFIDNKTNDKLIFSDNVPNYFDIKSIQSKIAAAKLIGLGITISSENERVRKYLNKYISENKINDLLHSAIYDSSYYGGVIFTLDKSPEGSIIMSYVSPEVGQNVGKVYCTPIKAEIGRRLMIGTKLYYLQETYTKNEIIRSVKVDTGGGHFYQDLSGEMIPPELQFKEYEKHNLGFVPIEEGLNKPYYNQSGLVSNYEKCSDDYNVRHLAYEINKLIKENSIDAIINKTMIFGRFTKAQMAELNSSTDNIKRLIGSRVFYETADSPTQNKMIETQSGAYDGAKYLEPMERLINLYFLGCGYSDVIPKQSDMTQAETLLIKDLDQQTTKEKRQRLINLLNNLFAKLLVFNGMYKNIKKAKDMVSIEIKDNVVYNRLQLTSFLIQNIESGLMSRTEAIAMARDLDDKDEVEIIKAEIDREREEDVQSLTYFREQEQRGQMELAQNNMDSGMGDMAPDEDSQGAMEEIGSGEATPESEIVDEKQQK